MALNGLSFLGANVHSKVSSKLFFFEIQCNFELKKIDLLELLVLLKTVHGRCAACRNNFDFGHISIT